MKLQGHLTENLHGSPSLLTTLAMPRLLLLALALGFKKSRAAGPALHGALQFN